MIKDFQTLKDAFAKAPIRAAPDFESGEELILTTDYSSEAVGWVLSQVQQGRERMIAAGGRKCNLAERHYPSWQGEMLGLGSRSGITSLEPDVLKYAGIVLPLLICFHCV